MRAALAIVLVACGSRGAPAIVEPTAPQPITGYHELVLDATPKERRRMVPAESFLRSYMMWFGGLAPIDIQKRARPGNLFDQWADYINALGLPEYMFDIPRVTQSNTVMLAAIGRLGEALCVRSVERDLHNGAPIDSRVIFAFDPKPSPTLAEFTAGFDVLHRTFLGYPAELAPADRVPRFYAYYQQVAARPHAKSPLTPDETAWVAICTALVMHPEAGLY